MNKRDSVFVGKYGFMRENYLKKHNESYYFSLLQNGELEQHLLEVDKQAREIVDVIVEKLAENDGCNEKLKASDQMRWVGLMENYKAQAEEFVMMDLIYR